MNAPHVSVVMGVFNAAATVELTVRSVLEQEGVALELIVVDDGSTDGTGPLLDRMASHDARLRVLHQPNAGLTRSLVRGCAEATAPLIARQDAGDVSLPGRLRAEAALFGTDPALAFVSCGTEYVDISGALLYEQRGTGRAGVPADIIDLRQPHGVIDGPTHHGSVMFRRDAYAACGGYRTEFYFGQDWDLWYRLAQHGRFCMLPRVLYRACVGPGDISATRRPQQEQLAALSLRALRERLAGRSDGPVLAEAALVRPMKGAPGPNVAADAHYFLGECLRRRGNAERAAYYFSQAIRLRPWLAKAWVRLAQTRFGRAARRG